MLTTNTYKWLVNSSKLKTLSVNPTVSRDINHVNNYVLLLQRANGIKIPAVIQASPDIVFSYSLSMSLYHSHTKTFFGNTWISLDDNEYDTNGASVDIDFNQLIYFRSSINDPLAVGVVEVVLQTKNSRTGELISKYGVGWSIIRLFGRSELEDTRDKNMEKVNIRDIPLYTGTPRVLLFLEESDWETSLNKFNGSHLSYKMQTHERLEKIAHLIPENFLLGSYDELPGLKAIEINIGDDKPIMIQALAPEKKKYAARPQKPILADTYNMELKDFKITIPKDFENEMLLYIWQEKCRDANLPIPDQPNNRVAISSRTLKVGIHNGYNLINPNTKGWSLIQMEKFGKTLLVHDGVVKIKGYVEDKNVAVVFELEYVVSVPKSEDGKTLPETLTVLVGSAIHIPVAGHEFIVSNIDYDYSITGRPLELKLTSNPSFTLSESVPYRSSTVNEGGNIEKGKTPKSVSIVPMVLGLEMVIPDIDLSHYSRKKQKKIKQQEIRAKKSKEDEEDERERERANRKKDDKRGNREDSRERLSARSPSRERRKSRSKSPSPSPESVRGASSKNKNKRRSPSPLSSDSDRGKKSNKKGDRGRRDDDYKVKKIEDRREREPDSDEEWAPNYSVPLLDPPELAKNSGLLASFLRLPLNKTGDSSRGDKMNNDGGLIGTIERDRDKSKGTFTSPQNTMIIGTPPLSSNKLSRAARTQLSKAGVTDTFATAEDRNENVNKITPSLLYPLEIQDERKLNVISLTFAAFRAIDDITAPPKSLFFTFQFYCCQPTKTDNLFLQGREEKKRNSKEETHYEGVYNLLRNSEGEKASLAIKFNIDTSLIEGDIETKEFTQYLATKALYIDVWDGESLIPIGTVRIMLNGLLRQGAPTVRSVNEYNIFSSNNMVFNDQSNGGQNDISHTPVVGKLQMVISNSGKKGNGAVVSSFEKDTIKGASESGDRIPLGEISSSYVTTEQKKPRMRVRARPLADVSHELKAQLLHNKIDAPTSKIDRLGTDQYCLRAEEYRSLLDRFRGEKPNTIIANDLLVYLADFLPNSDKNVSKSENEEQVLARILEKLKDAFKAKDEVKKEFKSFDKYDDGYVREKDFFSVLSEFKIDLHGEEEKIILNKYKINGDKFDYPSLLSDLFSSKEIKVKGSKQEVVHEIIYKVGRYKSREDIIVPFEERDEDKKGTLSERSFKRALEYMDSGLKENEIETVVNFLHNDKNGGINYREFIRMALVNASVLKASRDKIVKAVSKFGTKNISSHLEKLFQKWTQDKAFLTVNEFCEVLSEIGLSILNRTSDVTNEVTNLPTEDRSKVVERQIERLRKLREMRDRDKRVDQEEKHDEIVSGKRLEKVRVYRDSIKRDIVSKLLTQSVTHSMSLHASFGKPVWFEFPLTNPYNHEERFQIKISDSVLRVVKEINEWRHLRKFVPPVGGEVSGMVESDMFTEDNEVILGPNESIKVPFSFISFASGPVPFDPREATNFNDEILTNPPIKAQQITVSFNSTHHQHTVSLLHVHIKPRPFVTHRALRFYQPENEIFKRCIKLYSDFTYSDFDNNKINKKRQKMLGKFVHCPDRNVVIEIKDSVNDDDPLDMFFKYRCSSFPSVGQFFLLFYADQFHSILDEVWHVSISSMLKKDLHGITGQGSTSELLIKGDNFNRRVKCFSSRPNEITFYPNHSFQLVSAAFNKVEMMWVPLSAGRQVSQVHIVDTDSNLLMGAWLVTSIVSSPLVTKSFDVHLPVGKASKKRIAYLNQWDQPRCFLLRTNNPNILQVKEERLEIGPNAQGHIRLLFSKIMEPCTMDLLVFVNDEEDQNEESLGIRAVFS